MTENPTVETSLQVTKRVKKIVSTWESWHSQPVAQPKLIRQLGGYTNLSFLVTDGQSRWVVRLNGDRRDAGISQSNEMSAITAAHLAGIAPGIAFQGEDFLVVEYVSGEKPNLDDIAEIGALFADVHSLNVTIQPIDLLKHLGTYHRQVAPDIDITQCFQEIMALEPVEKCSLVPCHQDLTLDNMIKTDNGIAVIDWEYAALSDPAYDLAVFSYSHELDAAQLSDLLANYNRVKIDLRYRIRYFEKVYALIEILWWLDRGKRQEHKIDKLKALLH